jgi:hypothetical protein
VEAKDSYNSDQLLHEIETHVQRIFEYHNPRQPYAQQGNVTDKRGTLVNARKRFIDQCIEEHLKSMDMKQFVLDLKRNGKL